jgi:hypothetical protein
LRVRNIIIAFTLLYIGHTNISYSQFTDSPHLSVSIQNISEFIASDKFKELTKNNSSYDAIDSLFLYSLNYCNNNISETLLALTFATLPFYEMPISFPIYSSKINIPLPAPTKIVFDKKQNNLIKNIFFDIGKNSDKDKLPHFFGNAYLSYNAASFNLSKFMSILVELFEHSFKVQGAIDYRDLIVNSLGDTFGRLIRHNNELHPSDVLKLYYLYHLFPGQ